MGAAVTIINEQIYARLPQKPGLTKCLLELKSYGGMPRRQGRHMLSVEYEGQEKTSPVIVVPGSQPCLLGRDGLVQLKLESRFQCGSREKK